MLPLEHQRASSLQVINANAMPVKFHAHAHQRGKQPSRSLAPGSQRPRYFNRDRHWASTGPHQGSGIRKSTSQSSRERGHPHIGTRKIVKNIPYPEGDQRITQASASGATCQPADRQEHQQGCRFPDHSIQPNPSNRAGIHLVGFTRPIGVRRYTTTADLIQAMAMAKTATITERSNRLRAGIPFLNFIMREKYQNLTYGCNPIRSNSLLTYASISGKILAIIYASVRRCRGQKEWITTQKQPNVLR